MRVAATLLLITGLAIAAGQDKFAGTWQASFKNTVFLVLKVKAGEKISGTMNAGGLTLNDEGDLQEVRPVGDNEAPIFFAHVDGDKLVFEFQDDDDDVLSFELKLTAEDAGELRIVDKDHPKLKGFAVKRVKAG
ncbi:MAG TPA: hypothetical protein VMJ75_27225 [Candidatus Acidoferrales bacterium]|nr:hypothetical protein [Candidatus Acidoferrales bacterium]